MAAFSLDPAVVQFLLSSSEWSDTDIMDALKLQAAVLTAVDHLMYGYRFAGEGRDVFGRICPPDLLNCFKMEEAFLDSEMLLSNADELLVKAFDDVHSPDVNISSDQIRLHGHVVREATTTDDVNRLKQLKPLPTTSGGDLCGVHFHTLLVLKRLAPDSQLYLRYVTALASEFWEEFGFEPLSRAIWMQTVQIYGRSRDADELLACYEILLQLSPTTLAPLEQTRSALPKCFPTLAFCIAHLVQTLCARELMFHAVPLVQWLCHAVEEALPSLVQWLFHDVEEASRSLVKFTAHLVACILCLLSEAESADVRQQVPAVSKVVGGMLTSTSRCSRYFHHEVMLDLLQRIGAIEEPHRPQTAVTSGVYLRQITRVVRATPVMCGSTITSPDVLETVLVALLDEGTALPEGKISTSFLVTADHSSLFKAMVRHGLDIISRRYEGLPLLVYAVRSSSADIVEHMLDFGAGQGWMDFQKAQLEKDDGPVVATSTTSEINVDSRWHSPDPAVDLPDIAARRGSCRTLQALHRSGISATKPATLFQAALHTNPDTLEFLLATQCWNSADVCDALRLQSAYCLMESLSATSTIATEGSHHEETATTQSTTSLNDGHLRNSQSCPLLRTAFRTFARAADEEKQANRRRPAANTGAPVISLQQSIQRDVTEAQTVDELDALGEIQFPCANGRCICGWHFHALLVMERLRCPLKIYDQFLLNLVVKLSERGHSSSSLPSVSAETCSTVSDYGYRPYTQTPRPSDRFARNKSGAITSMDPMHMRNIFAIIDLSSYLERLICLGSNLTALLFQSAPAFFAATIDRIGQLALWLITNCVPIDYTAVFCMFSRLMTKSVIDRIQPGASSTIARRYARLFLALVANKGTLGREQLMKIVQQEATLSTNMSLSLDGRENILGVIWDIVAEHGHGVVDDSSDDLCLPCESMSEPQVQRTRLTTRFGGSEAGTLPLPLVCSGSFDRTRAELDTSNEQVFQSAHSLVRNDPVVTETVSLLLENGIELPEVFCQRDTLHQLLLMEFPHLLRVLAGHGVDVWICDRINDKPLIVRACATSSPDMVNCLLDGQQEASDSHHDCKPVKVDMTMSQHRMDQLWIAAAQRSDDRVLKVLHQRHVPATKAALLESAMRSDPRFVTFMLEKLPFTTEEAADALKLYSAYCLFSSVSSAKSRLSKATIGAQVSSLVKQMSNETAPRFQGRSPSMSSSGEPSNELDAGASGIQVGILDWLTSGAEEPPIAALRSFQLSLQYNEKQPAEPAVLDIVGHRIQEAQSWDDFKRLAQVSIPTQGKEPLSGVLLHGLLVVGRVLPKHPLCFQLLKKVIDLIYKRCITSSAGRQPAQNLQLATQEDTSPELISVLAQYSLLTHHLRLWQEMTQDELGQVDADTVHNLSMAAIEVLRHLLASGVIVDTLPVFCWLSNHLAFGLGYQWKNSSVLANVLKLLTDMVELHRQSEQTPTELHHAVALIVKGSLNCAEPCEGILHLATELLIDFRAGKFSRQQATLSEGRRSHLMKLVRILLDEGGHHLVNRVNGSSKTAAHKVISLAKSGLFVMVEDDTSCSLATALELLTLFDEYGQHWDSFYNSQHSLLEVLTTVPQLSLFCSQLLCQPRTLQCLSAMVAVAWCDSEVWKRLPENIKQIVLQHQRATPQPVPPYLIFSSPDSYGSPYHCESLYSSPGMFYWDCDDDDRSMDYS